MDRERFAETHRDILLDFAKKYIWWEKPEEALHRPYRVLASAMNMGSLEDYQRIRRSFDSELLCEVLKNAKAGWFSKRSWSFWHRVLELVDAHEAVPPLPERMFS